MKKQILTMLAVICVVAVVAVLVVGAATHATKVGWSQTTTIGSQKMIFQETCVKGRLILVGGYSESIAITQLWEMGSKGPQPIVCE